MKLRLQKRFGAILTTTHYFSTSFKTVCILMLLFLFNKAEAQNQIRVSSSTGTGAGGVNYSTLGSAFNAINSGAIHTGSIVIQVNANTTENSPAVLNASGAGACSYSTVVIQPTIDGATIAGNFTTRGRGVIELNGADNVTIDGDNALTSGTNKNLTITFSTIQDVSQSLIRLVTSTLPMDCNGITIKNCTIKGNVNNGNIASITSSTSAAALSFGIVVAGGGSTSSATAAPSALSTGGVALITTASVANNFVVDNCTINNVGVAIDFYGNTTASSNIITITNNTIGTAGSLSTFPGGPASTVYFKGIFYRGTRAATITGNTIQGICSYFISGSTPNMVSAIECNSTFNNGGGQFNISNNIINGIWSNNASAVSTSSQIARGIVMLGSASTTTIICNKNSIRNVKSNTISNTISNAVCAIDLGCNATNSWMAVSNNSIDDIYAAKAFGATGISIATGGNNANIYNNTITGIVIGAGGTSINSFAAGIKLSAGINHKVYHNSILLQNSYSNFQHITAGIAALVTAANANIDIRNNIVANYNSTSINTTSIDAALIFASNLTNTNKYIVNNNAYFGPISTATNYMAYLYNTVTFSNANSSNSYSYANFNESATSPATNFRSFSSTLNTTNNDNASFAIPLIGTRPFTAGNDLHISTAFANNPFGTRLESRGATGLTVVGTGLSKDFEGDNRNGPTGSINGGAVAPDLGADEFDGKQFISGCTGNPIGGILSTSSNNVYCTNNAPSVRSFTVAGHSENIENIVVQWQSSTTSAIAGFTDIPFANTTTLQTNSAPTQTTWYRAAIICTKTGNISYQSVPAITQLTTDKIWIGGNGKWSVANNWICGVPSSTDNIIIENGQPSLDVNFSVAGNLTISGTGKLTIQPNVLLDVTTTGRADFGGKSVTFQSNNTGTAMLGKIKGTLTNTTNVTVERYIPAHSQRAWRLLSVPTYGNGQTIRQAWQEGDVNLTAQQNNNAFGTQITSTGTIAQALTNGFDNISATTSLSYYNNGVWSPVQNTNTSIETKAGYFLYVRGNRSVGPNSLATAANSAATLRTTGTIYQGNQTYNTIPRNSFGLIGNLYPCTIDFTKLQKSGGVSNTFYIWDAQKMSGTSLGSYQTFSATNGYECILPGGSFTMGNVYTEIQSGQAFMVGTNNSAGSITLTEDCKVNTNSNLGLRPSTPANQLQRIKTRLFQNSNNTPNIVDANVVVFNNNYSNDVADEDAIKVNNSGENIGITKGEKTLTIEGRKMVSNGDVITFNTWNLKPQNYTLELVADNMYQEGLEAELVDKYTNIKTLLDLQNTTNYSFTVNNEAASFQKNRFSIIFKSKGGNTNIAETKTGITISPNPVAQHTANISFSKMISGNYTLQLFDLSGKLVYKTIQHHNGGSNNYQIVIPSTTAKGLYQLEVKTSQQNKFTQQVLIEN